MTTPEEGTAPSDSVTVDTEVYGDGNFDPDAEIDATQDDGLVEQTDNSGEPESTEPVTQDPEAVETEDDESDAESQTDGE